MCGWVQGLPEAGIDGGGLFREFLQEAIKEAFRQFRPFFSRFALLASLLALHGVKQLYCR